MGKNNRKPGLSLSFITPANLWVWVNQGWNSRTQVTQVWQIGGVVVGESLDWMGDLQCQHSCSTALNIFTQYVTNLLSILVLIRSPETRQKGGGKSLYPLGDQMRPPAGECGLFTSNQLLMPGTKRHWAPQAGRTAKQ